jgi:ubiquinone/menaquinone biosynthesis C-methylase UbiE
MWLLVAYVILKKTIRNLLGFPAPHTNTFWFDAIGSESRKVKEYATTWRAMDIIYNHPFPLRRTLRGLVDEFYWNSLNCQALRNRLKLIKTELRFAISQIDTSEKEIRIMSLACGSADASIEIIAEFKKKGRVIRAVLVDIDQDALNRAENLAMHYGVEDQIETRKDSAYSLSEISRDFKPHIIEMLGLLDYIPEGEVIALTKKIQESLEPKGVFITCNISPNAEQHFLKWVIDWPMVYRNPEELADIAGIVGFSDYRLIYEPLKIHGLLIAKKS